MENKNAFKPGVFTPTSYTPAGSDTPIACSYRTIDADNLEITFTIPGTDEKSSWTITSSHPSFPQALVAAVEAEELAKDEPAAELVTVEKVTDEKVSEKKVDAAKERHGEVPEKYFKNMKLEGNGWTIFFDASIDRARVIFNRKPPRHIRELVKEAGFWWSPKDCSWNRKMTFKSWRAGQQLHQQLGTVSWAI